MKKKLLLLALAAALPLSACGEKEEPKDEPGQQQGSGDHEQGSGDHEETVPTEQEIREAALTESYATFGKLLMGEQTATAMKPFFAQGAAVVSSHEVDVAKVYPYLVRIGDSDGVLKVLLEVSSMYTDGLIDDTVYYFLGFGDGLLKATYAMSGVEDPAALATITAIDTHADEIATNTIGVINTVLEVVSDVMLNPSAITGAVEKLEEESPVPYKVNAEGLKTAIEAIAGEVEKLMPLKANLNYLADFVLPVVNMVVDVPNEVNVVFKYVKISDVINAAFDAIGFVVKSLTTLPDEYYAHLAGIQDPIENIAYAILGYASYAKKLLTQTITMPKVEVFVDKFLTAGVGIATEILAAYQIQLPEAVSSLLSGTKVKVLLLNVANLVLDVLKFDLESINAEKLAAFVPAIVSLIPVMGPSTDVETGGEVHEVVEKTEGPNQMMVVLGQLIVEVNSILTELAAKDEEVTKLLNDVYSVLLAGYNIFSDISSLVGVDEKTVAIIDGVATLLQTNSSHVTNVVLDVIDVLSDLFGAFVPDTSKPAPAEIDLLGLIGMIASSDFDPTMLASLQVKEERIAQLPKLLVDVYTLAGDMMMAEDLVEIVAEFIQPFTETSVEVLEAAMSSAEGFAGTLYSFVKAMLGVQSQGAQD